MNDILEPWETLVMKNTNAFDICHWLFLANKKALKRRLNREISYYIIYNI
jgi:hypothetical protein